MVAGFVSEHPGNTGTQNTQGRVRGGSTIIPNRRKRNPIPIGQVTIRGSGKSYAERKREEAAALAAAAAAAEARKRSDGRFETDGRIDPDKISAYGREQSGVNRRGTQLYRDPNPKASNAGDLRKGSANPNPSSIVEPYGAGSRTGSQTGQIKSRIVTPQRKPYVASPAADIIQREIERNNPNLPFFGPEKPDRSSGGGGGGGGGGPDVTAPIIEDEEDDDEGGVVDTTGVVDTRGTARNLGQYDSVSEAIRRRLAQQLADIEADREAALIGLAMRDDEVRARVDNLDLATRNRSRAMNELFERIGGTGLVAGSGVEEAAAAASGDYARSQLEAETGLLADLGGLRAGNLTAYQAAQRSLLDANFGAAAAAAKRGSADAHVGVETEEARALTAQDVAATLYQRQQEAALTAHERQMQREREQRAFQAQQAAAAAARARYVDPLDRERKELQNQKLQEELNQLRNEGAAAGLSDAEIQANVDAYILEHATAEPAVRDDLGVNTVAPTALEKIQSQARIHGGMGLAERVNAELGALYELENQLVPGSNEHADIVRQIADVEDWAEVHVPAIKRIIGTSTGG